MEFLKFLSWNNQLVLLWETHSIKTSKQTSKQFAPWHETENSKLCEPTGSLRILTQSDGQQLENGSTGGGAIHKVAATTGTANQKSPLWPCTLYKSIW